MDNEFDMRRIKELDEPIFVVFSSTDNTPGSIVLTKLIGYKNGIEQEFVETDIPFIEPIIPIDGFFEFAGECNNYYGCFPKESLTDPELFIEIAEQIKPKVDKEQ